MRRPLLPLAAATAVLTGCGGGPPSPATGTTAEPSVTTVAVPAVAVADGPAVLGAAFGPDGLVLLLGGETPTLVRGTDPDSWEPVQLTELAGTRSAELAVRADGSAVVTGRPVGVQPDGQLVLTATPDGAVSSVRVPSSSYTDGSASYSSADLLSADGSTLVQVVQRDSYLPGSLQTELDGTVLVQTADTATGQVRATTVLQLGGPDQVGRSSTAISPDGNQVAVVIGSRTDPAAAYDRRLVRLDAALATSEVDLDDGGIRNGDTAVAVADDGTARVLTSSPDGPLGVVEVAPGASAAEPRGTVDPDRADDPLIVLGIGPVSGDQLAAVVRAGQHGASSLRVVDVGGDGAGTEIELCDPAAPAVSPDGSQIAVPEACSGDDRSGDPVVLVADVG